MFQNYMQCQTVIIYDINRKRQFYFCPPTRLPDFVATEISKVSKDLWPLLMHDCTHSKVNRPEAATIPVQQKKLLLKTLQDSQEKNLRRSIFLIKVPTQMFSCEYCEIFKNTFFEEHLRLLLNKHIIQDKKF